MFTLIRRKKTDPSRILYELDSKLEFAERHTFMCGVSLTKMKNLASNSIKG